MKLAVALIGILLISGCSFHGEVYKIDKGWAFKANQPCLIKADEEKVELDGRTEPIIKIDIPLNKVGI